MANIFFKYDMQEDRETIHNIMQADKMAFALADIYEHIRKKLKYEELSDVEYHWYERMRNDISHILEDNEVKLNGY